MNTDMEFPCATDDEANRFCEHIAMEMVQRFSISMVEAVTRINRQWRGQQIGGPEEIAYHEDEEFWAQDIFWGHDSSWWITGEKRTSMNLPPLTPKSID